MTRLKPIDLKLTRSANTRLIVDLKSSNVEQHKFSNSARNPPEKHAYQRERRLARDGQETWTGGFAEVDIGASTSGIRRSLTRIMDV